MIKFSGSVLFIDNTCLVHFFEVLYYSNRDHLFNTIAILNSEFDQIWIPETVKHEFCLKKRDKKRNRLLNWAINNFQSIQICPIKVSKSEITMLIGNTEENAGEADALLQMNKGRISESYVMSKLTFFTQDKAALRMMNEQGHNTLDYNDFRHRLLESGIILPS